jgi:GAF domain-containing protein
VASGENQFGSDHAFLGTHITVRVCSIKICIAVAVLVASARAVEQVTTSLTHLAVENCAAHPLFAGWSQLEKVSPGSVLTFIGVPIRNDAKAIGLLARPQRAISLYLRF